jgi:hypothetical protein
MPPTADALQAHGLADRSLVCYAVKANSNLAILNLFARLGAGFDIVSGGELARVLAAGGSADRIVFSGVGKSRAEMRAALEAGIHCFNVESASELDQLDEVAGSLGPPRTGVAARQSRRRRENPSLHLHRPQDGKIRHRLRRSLRYLPSRRAPAAYRGEGHRLPHRLATARSGTGRRGRGQGAGAGRSPGRRGHRAGTHRPRRRHGHPVPRR